MTLALCHFIRLGTNIICIVQRHMHNVQILFIAEGWKDILNMGGGGGHSY